MPTGPSQLQVHDRVRKPQITASAATEAITDATTGVVAITIRVAAAGSAAKKLDTGHDVQRSIQPVDG